MSTREPDCRQDDVLSDESAVALGLIRPADPNHRAVVVTHDCDLFHESEPRVEVIVAETVPAEDPCCTYAKHPRRLHLVYEGTPPLILELRHVDRRGVPRDEFLERAFKDPGLTLPSNGKRMLKQWLAARYGRLAFPNEFEKRLRQGKVDQKIERVLQQQHHATHVVGLFFDLGEQRGKELVEGEPYILLLSVVYDTKEGGLDAKEAAERVAAGLRELFETTYGKPDAAREIALEECEAVPDTHMTLADLRRVEQWRLEHISLRDDDQGDFLPVGEMPA